MRRLEPVGLQPKRPRITRRQLLGTVASTPLVASAPSRAAGLPNELRFEIDADDRRLTIRELSPPPASVECHHWDLPSRSFGPHARFELSVPPSTPEAARRLTVRNVQLGALSRATLAMEFTCDGRDWFLAIAGSPWAGVAQFGPPVRFGAFCQQAALAHLTVSGDVMARTLDAMFQGRVMAAAGPAYRVALSTDVIWHLSTSVPGLSAIGGQVATTSLAAGWAAEATPGERGEAYFVGHALAALTGPDSVRIGDPAGHHLRLAADLTAASLEITVLPAGRSGGLQTVAALQHGGTAGQLCIRQADRVIVDGVPVRAAAVTETALPDAVVRTVLWGQAGPAGGSAELATPIGPMMIGPPTGDGPTASAGSHASRLLQAASGDKRGAREATTFVVHDARAGLRRVAVELSLTLAAVAPPDTSYSRLDFAASDLELLYEDGQRLLADKAEYPRRRTGSWLWVGPQAEAAASLDLSRANLLCVRDDDFVRLTFSFQDLLLRFAPAPAIHPKDESCRVMQRADGTVVDGRPVLVVDFGPQHVMEEALFRPEPPPLPDVPVPPRERILAELAACKTMKDRVTHRQEVQRLKRGQLGDDFGALADRYANLAKDAPIPDDQKVYIGPFALDPDAMALARQAQRELRQSVIVASATAMLGRVDAAAAKLAASKQLLPVGPEAADPWGNARRNETALEQSEPLYAVWREFWLDQVTADLAGGTADLGTRDPTARARLTAYLTPANRPASPPPPFEVVKDKLLVRFADVVAGQSNDGKGDGLMGARLSRPSRLAFRLNCQPAEEVDAVAAQSAGFARAERDGPGPGRPAFAPIPFTFDGLTDWSRHEPAVTRRARKLFAPQPSGIVPPLGAAASSTDDLEILRFQRISAGSTTAAQRFGEIRASLAEVPTELETAIELPSRLILSTAQDAVWLTSRALVRRTAPTPAHGSAEHRIGIVSRSRPRALWSARLVTSEVLPSLRVVASPDLRPMALGVASGAPRLPGQGPPPRGPLAPWFIGPDEIDGYGAMQAPTQDTPLARMLTRWIGLRSALPGDHLRVFRTSLDANDRHQLVLQSGAYGLPVIGKRGSGSDPSNVDNGGALVPGSGQIEPGEAFALLDAVDGQAIYRPIPLAVQQLSLTALGGSFQHDTRFVPAMGALDAARRPLFDGFSIERWQHEVVLGRDVQAEVVYKGYLMPFGHSASLVKLTERAFVRTKAQGIKAVLRQRMFLRVGTPLMRFPALGQPYRGRLWCGMAVVITTERTPDLLDPTAIPDAGVQGEYPNGRVALNKQPGLAFWPRTDISDGGLVLFDVTIDGAAIRLPLLFVDTIAAGNKAALKALVDYYNDAAEAARRTVEVGGQTLRYAPEDKPGDASLPTTRIVLRAHGRVGDGSGPGTAAKAIPAAGTGAWIGPLDEFAPTSVLQGADQPSFYPALEVATVRLSQVERMTGGKPAQVDVQYDGHYVRYGFAGSREAAQNALGVFLDLRTVVPMDMGAHGERSGGIGRPNSNIVALGRTKGPLGGNAPMTYGGGAGPKPNIDWRSGTLLTGEQGIAAGLVSLVPWFETPQAPTAPAAVPGGLPPAAPSKDQQSKLALIQSYFSGDAKLLGVVTLQQLMALLQVDVDLPELKELVEYGAAVGDQADAAAEQIRTRVLLPLRAALARIGAAWSASIAPAGTSPNPPISAATLFPDIDADLSGLRAAVEAALATADAASLLGGLGVIYTAGRRLVNDFAILAAHPVERLTDAAQRALNGVVADLLSRAAALADALGPIAPLLAALGPNQIDAIVGWLDDATGTVDQLNPVLPDFVTVAQTAAGTGLPDDFMGKLKDAQGKIPRLDPGLILRDALASSEAGTAIQAGLATWQQIVSTEARTVTDALAAITPRDPAERVAQMAVQRAWQVWSDGLPTEAALIAQTAGRIADTVAAATALAAAIAAKPPRIEDAMAAAAALAALLFGIDAEIVATKVTEIATVARTEFDRAIGAWLRADADKTASVAAERVACAQTPPQRPTGGSTEVLRSIVATIDAVSAARQGLHAATPPPSGLNDGDVLADAVVAALTELHCDVVQAMAALATLPEQPRGWAQSLAALQRVRSDALARLQAVATAVSSFPHQGTRLWADILPSSTVVAADAQAGKALAEVADALLRALGTASLAGIEAVAALQGAIEAVGLPDLPAAAALADALTALSAALRPFTNPTRIADPASIRAVLDSTVYPGVTFADVADGWGRQRLVAVVAAERQVLAALVALPHAVDGLPGDLRDRVEAALVEAKVFGPMANAYGTLIQARQAVLGAARELPLLAAGAVKAMLVDPNPAWPSTCAGAVTEACDRLVQEKAVLDDLVSAKPTLGPAKRLELVQFLRSWPAGQAAPVVIVRKVRDAVEDVARGNVLAALDIGSYRDLIEDAIASLVPTKISLSYAFASSIRTAGSPDAIFQPKPGAPFGITVDGSIDLRDPRKDPTFRATAQLGPFDVKLIGGLVDALTLSFGGASFEAGSGISPQFHVQYLDFTIGESLAFARQLQSYLSPKEGSGLFVQPLSDGAGLEVGYGIDLGIISFGETSFFNIVLNVSAELPFDNQQARFKVALGRRLSPFTMSVLPFAGSGFFAVIANAQGVIGFEASFEFGGGGSLAFGPLTAQARIQVGVYVRLLKIKDRLSTTISGTFFAGGTANIWIFSFSTSLAVRLGSADGGAMYGEAVFTFSFSLGLVDYDFAVTAYKKQPAVGHDSGGDSRQGALPARTMLADAARPGAVLTDAAAPAAAACRPGSVSVDAAGQAARWDDYREYFDLSLLKECSPAWP